MTNRDYYEILEVDKGASEAELKKGDEISPGQK
jgi:DnaJ-class molecular chaperone